VVSREVRVLPLVGVGEVEAGVRDLDEHLALGRLRNRDVDELQHLRSAELRDLNGAHDRRTLSGQDIDRLVRICIDSHIGLDQSGWSSPVRPVEEGGHMATEHAAPVPATDRDAADAADLARYGYKQ